jgi:hypothetical protein
VLEVVHQGTARLSPLLCPAGHGFYPSAGTQKRLFGVANDKTSAQGRVWRPAQCRVVTMPGLTPQVPSVKDRGALLREPPRAAFTPRKVKLGAASGAPVDTKPVEVVVEQPEWMAWLRVFWGTSASPARQDWFRLAEHPTGASVAKRTFLPCAS